jgi:hypothetical protein
MTELPGTWTLLSCDSIRGDRTVATFGTPPSGQLQYTADGRMSAFLMDPAWAAAGDPAADSFTQFFAYAGRWHRDGDTVTHDILFASQPARVGTRFVRTIEPIDATTIALLTLPEVSRSGRRYVTRLVWRRVGDAGLPA